MRTLVITLFALLLGTAIFVAATGLTATTLSLRTAALGYSGTVIGLVMGAYFAGFVAGTKLGPRIIARTGHIRAFAVFAALACAAVLGHALLASALWWALLRFITGGCVVGLYMVVESWLNERTSNERRGLIFATYQGISLLSLGLGQYLLLVGADTAVTPFIIAGTLFALGLVPIALTRLPEPAPVRPARLHLGKLWATSPLGVLGTAIAAICGGVLFSLGPIYARYTGMDTGQVAVFMSTVIFGGALLQWPIGHLSDFMDRRSIILGVALAGSLLAVAALLLHDRWLPGFYLAAFCYGGAVFSLYPLCVAHTNDHAPPDQLVTTSSGLLLTYGFGAVLGPVIGGPLLSRLGAGAFFALLAIALGGLAITALVRMFLRPPPPKDAQEPFVMLSRTSHAALEMLPDVVQEPKAGAAPGEDQAG